LIGQVEKWDNAVGLAKSHVFDLTMQVQIPTTIPSPAVIVYGLVLAALSFLITWAVGKPVLAVLKAKKIGKTIRIEEPQSNQVKMGTPTMGGIMILASILVVTVVFILIPTHKASLWVPVFVILACGILGGVDDLMTITPRPKPVPAAPNETKQERRQRQRLEQYGLTARFKLAWLLIVSLVVALAFFYGGDQQKMYVPFVASAVVIGVLFIPICTIGIAGMANAVNLTDGLDTLAASCAATSFFAYAIIGYLQNQPQVTLLGFAIAGACMGFLWYNAYPAQVFMGDTGSLTLGALLAVLAFQTSQWLLLPLIGGVFFIEMMSVILQVSYFKLTKGKRLFKMTPIHYHFLRSGWSETQVTMRFWLFGLVAAMVGIALAMQ
jgi:phospho-N-acetylmuramoyl-pentapeptide-transferase